MKYLSIDPGNRTGWAAFDEQGAFLEMGIIEGHDNFLDWLESQTPEEVIMERYRNRIGGKGAAIHGWSENETSQLIGAIRRVCSKRGWKLHFQDASNGLAFGLRFLGVYAEYYQGSKRVKHVPDNISALAHGTYFLRQNRIQK